MKPFLLFRLFLLLAELTMPSRIQSLLVASTRNRVSARSFIDIEILI
jgi:hypothetical protein